MPPYVLCGVKYIDLVSLATLFRQGNLDGGQIRLLIDSPDLKGDTQVTLFDDTQATNMSVPGAFYGYCANKLSDCHSWDSTRGIGYFTWTWVKQNSDGQWPIP